VPLLPQRRLSATQLQEKAHELLAHDVCEGPLEWEDGPTLTEISRLLGAYCPVIISQQDYLGLPFSTQPSGSRPVTLTAHRKLSPLVVVTVAARYWAVHAGPLVVDEKVRTQCVEIAETSGSSFPVPEAIAKAVLANQRTHVSTTDDPLVAAFEAIALLGYDALWAQAFSSLT